jgi:hypothetical protein
MAVAARAKTNPGEQVFLTSICASLSTRTKLFCMGTGNSVVLAVTWIQLLYYVVHAVITIQLPRRQNTIHLSKCDILASGCGSVGRRAVDVGY